MRIGLGYNIGSYESKMNKVNRIHENYPINDPTRPMVIVGSNKFCDLEGDDFVPYQYILSNQVKHLILIDGNNSVLHNPRPLIAEDIDLSLINAVILPDRIIKNVNQEGLYFYQTTAESGGNYFGDKHTCLTRKNTYIQPDKASVEKSFKLLLDSSFIARINPAFLQIDIEGHDLELLVDIINRHCRPYIIIYEWHYQDPNNVKALDHHLAALGYSNVQHPTNPAQNLCYIKATN